MGIKKKVTAAVESAATAVVERADAWLNLYTGFGDPDRDPMMSTNPTTTVPFTQTELDALFNDDHLAHKICTSLPSDALRKWVSLQIDDDAEGQGDEILEFIEDIGGRVALQEGLVWARQSGGCLLVLGVDDGQAPDKPLNEEAIRAFKFVNVIRADQARVKKYYADPAAPKFNEPELWEISSSAGMMMSSAKRDVHESRVIWLRGELTTPQRRKERQGWDMSSLQRAKGPLQRNALVHHAVASLLTKSNLLVFGVKGFSEMVKRAKEAVSAFQTRMQLARMAQSSNSWTIHDSEGETISNISVSFAGIPDVMDRSNQEAASAANMPVTKMWGISPAGMNATGESDLQLWEQQVEAYQVQYVKVPLERMVSLAMLTAGSATGSKVPESWSIAFAPLRVMTDEQLATVQSTISQALALLLDREVFTPEEVVLGPLFADGGLLASLAAVDTEAREAMLAAELERMVKEAKDPPPPPPKFGFGGPKPVPPGDDGEEGEGGDEPEPDAA